MKTNRPWLYLLAAVAGVALFVVWSRPSRAPTGSEEPQVPAASASARKESTNVTHQGASNPAPTPIPLAAKSARSAENARNLGDLRRAADVANVPIDFFGRVVDQDSNGVSGAVVKVSVRHWEVVEPGSQPPNLGPYSFQRITRTDGRFEINSMTGDAIDIESISKDGYESSLRTLRTYGPSEGNSDNPEVFRMWRRGEPQKLISHYINRIAIPVDGQPIQFDLFDGKKVASGGQLVVRVNRSPQTLPAGHVGYDWSATLEIPAGGLVASTDEFMYQAPESGYQRTYKVEMPMGATNWMSTLHRQFYIEGAGGKYYGNLGVDMPTFHSPPPIVLSLSVTLNPDGSRNLQP